MPLIQYKEKEKQNGIAKNTLKKNILEMSLFKKMNCPNCNKELENWVDRSELPFIKKNCKLFKKMFEI